MKPQLRQFACMGCDRSWWKKERVSECFGCHNDYKPLPRDEEWGWAVFQCDDCENEFRGYGHMTRTESRCYNCNSMVRPVEIFPPYRRGGPKSRKKHSCNGRNCFNRTTGGNGNPNKLCCHPKSNSRNVLVGSRTHR